MIYNFYIWPQNIKLYHYRIILVVSRSNGTGSDKTEDLYLPNTTVKYTIVCEKNVLRVYIDAA